MRLTYAADLPDTYRVALRAAATAWEEALPGLLTIEVSAEAPTTFHSNTSYVTVRTSTETYGLFGTYADAGAETCGAGAVGSYDTARIRAFPSMMDTLVQSDKTGVFIHEIGHLLTLGHPAAAERCRAVMYYVGCPTQGVGPYPDDIAGVLASLSPNLTVGFPADSSIALGNGSVLQGGGEPGSPVTVAERDADTRNRWTFVPTTRAGFAPTGERAGVIVNTSSGLCLASWSTDAARHAATEQSCYEPSERAGLFWSVSGAPDGAVTLREQRSGACLSQHTERLMVRAVLGDCANASAALSISRQTTPAAAPAPQSLTHPLVGQQSGRCLDVPSSDTTPGRQLALYDCNGGSNQKVRFHGESRVMTVFEPAAHRAEDGPDPTLCVQAAATADHTRIETARCRPDLPSQTWVHRGDGTIYNPASDKCINVSGGSTGNGSVVILWSCNDEENEVFNSPGVLGREPRVSVRTLLGTGKVLTVRSGGGTLNDDVDGENQNWTWIPVPGDTDSGMLASWQSPAGSPDLQCLGATPLAATTMRTCDALDVTLHWKASTNTNGSTTFASSAWAGECLDVAGGSTDESTAILLHECKASGDRRNQQWRVLPENPHPVASTPAAASAPITLSSRANSKHVTVRADKGSVLYPSSAIVGPGEVFDLTFNDDARGSVSFRSQLTGRYVSVHTVSSELIAGSATIGDREKFLLSESTEGWVALKSVSTGKFVVAEAGGDGQLFANRDAIGPWERFDLSDNRHLPEIAWNPGLGSVLASTPAVVFDPAQSRYLAAITGTDGALWWKARGMSWNGWQRIAPPSGSTIVGKPAMTASGGRIDVWALAADTRIYAISSADSGKTWGEWANLGLPPAASAPAVAYDPELRDTHLVARLVDGTTWHYIRAWNGRWAAAMKIFYGIQLIGDPAVTVHGESVDVFARGSDNQLYQTYSRNGGTHWTVVSGTTFGGTLTSSPSAAFDPVAGTTFVAVQGTDGRAYLNRGNGSWSGWRGIAGPTGGTFLDAPAVVAYGYSAQLFVRGTDGYGWYTPISSYY